MRRGLLGLILAGMLAAPVAAVASPPSPQTPPAQAPQTNQPQIHRFYWSSVSAKGRLGVSVVALNDELRRHFGAPEDRGLMVAHVEPSSAAATAGLQVGDVITDVAGKPVTDARDVRVALASAKRNDKVAIDVIRNGSATHIEATMTDDPTQDGTRASPDGWSAPSQFDDMQREFERDMQRMMEDLQRQNPSPGTNPSSHGLHHHGSGVDT